MLILPVLFLVPLLVLWLQKRIAILQSVGAVALCYFLGFAFSLLPLGYDKTLTQDVASVLVAIAIPLILFSLDISQVKTLTREFLLGFGAQIFTVILVAFLAALIAGKLGLPYASQLSGMISGLYTGGTPNLIAVGQALLPSEQAPAVISAAAAADFLVGGLYFLLIVTVIMPIYRAVLGSGNAYSSRSASANVLKEYDLSFLKHNKAGIGRLLAVFVLAVAVLGIGAGLEILISGDLSGSLYLMITVSVLGIAFSFVRPVREVQGSYQLGQYFVLVFSLGLSMSIDLGSLVSTALPTVLFFACAQISVAAIHLLLCRLLKISGGTALVTSVAGIYGPPFISPVASAWGDKKLIAPGIICGVLGLAIGNFLGLAVGLLLGFI